MPAYGSLNNLLLSRSEDASPEIGGAATIVMWSDRKAATIIEIQRFKTGARAGEIKAIIVQEDIATRTDGLGMTDAQAYRFDRDPDGATHIFKVTKYGYRSGYASLTVGIRSHYYDFTF